MKKEIKKRFLEVEIPESCLRSERVFIDRLRQEFHFPSYFGGNLDSVFDCMTDLSWLDYDEVILKIKTNNKRNVMDYDLLDNLISIRDYWFLEGDQNILGNKIFKLIY